MAEQIPGPDSPTVRGQALVRELLAVHQYLRNNLRAVRDGIAGLADGSEPAGPEIVEQARGLQAHCLFLCQTLHHHHRLEDIALFPTLLSADPALDSVIDRLQAEHRTIGVLLEQIEDVAASVPSADPGAAAAARDELDRLAAELETHLAYEEESLSPALARLTSFPY